MTRRHNVVLAVMIAAAAAGIGCGTPAPGIEAGDATEQAPDAPDLDVSDVPETLDAIDAGDGSDVCIPPSPNADVSSSIDIDSEPSLAINPTKACNLAVGWMHFLGATGRVEIRASASFDGGATWSTPVPLPHLGTHNSAGDVTLAFERTGLLDLAFVDITFDPAMPAMPFTDADVVFARSPDGGESFSTPVAVRNAFDTADEAVDRPWLAVDATSGPHDGRVYLTTMSLNNYNGVHDVHLKFLEPGVTDWSAAGWSPDILVDDPAYAPGYVGGWPDYLVSYGAQSVEPSGTLFVAYEMRRFVTSFLPAGCDPAHPFCLVYARLTDSGGGVFTARRGVIGGIVKATASAVVNTYAAAADPVRADALVAAWVDARYDAGDILYAQSFDGGATWSAPALLNDDPPAGGYVQDMVWMRYAPTGELVAGWRDRRLSGTASATLPFDVFVAYSSDGATFRSNERLSDASSSYSAFGAGNDFIGLDVERGVVRSAWADHRGADWDVYAGVLVEP